ncbi:MAG: hypothetical protein Q7S11_03540 [bacterium]|nr:hypothetical protein [bacterium]
MVAIILAIAVIAGGMFLWSRWVENKKETLVFERENTAQDTAKKLAESISQQDSDNDGLPDWEEALWKTDSQNSDTDSDGTLDSEEVKLGRNPTKKGPNDVLEKNIVKPSENSPSTYDPQSLNETDVFMRELLGNYFELKGTGNTGSQSLESLAKTMAGGIMSKGIPPAKTYRATNVSISDDSSSSMRVYGETMGTIFIGRSSKESELYILSQALSGSNTGTIEKLAQFEKEYIAMIKKLLLVNTPPALASTHLGFINEFGTVASAVGAMSNTLVNPVLGLSGVSQYQKSLVSIENYMKYTGSVFNSNGVIFKKGENGYLFTSMFERSQ